MPQLQPTGGGLAAQPQQQPGAAQTHFDSYYYDCAQQQAIDDPCRQIMGGCPFELPPNGGHPSSPCAVGWCGRILEHRYGHG